MRNRAKCKLCNTIIESLTIEDLIHCQCGEIAISGGLQKLECYANDFVNFLRVDDEGNEIIVSVKEKAEMESDGYTHPTKTELLSMLDEMISSHEHLPKEAMYAPVTHADFLSLLMLINAILRA